MWLVKGLIVVGLLALAMYIAVVVSLIFDMMMAIISRDNGAMTKWNTLALGYQRHRAQARMEYA